MDGWMDEDMTSTTIAVVHPLLNRHCSLFQQRHEHRHPMHMSACRVAVVEQQRSSSTEDDSSTLDGIECRCRIELERTSAIPFQYRFDWRSRTVDDRV